MSRVVCALACLALHGVLAESQEHSFEGANHTLTINVLGNSAFELYLESLGEGTGIVFEVGAIRELDADGNEVGSSKITHTIDSLEFKLHDAEENVVVDGPDPANSTKIFFDSSVSDIGDVKVEAYLFTEDGTVGRGTESRNVTKGDVKLHIELSDWSWCGPCVNGGGDNKVGEFIEFGLSVKMPADLSPDNTSIAGTVALGELEVGLSELVRLDGGAWEAMPVGFPKITVEGSTAFLTFRFPKFTSTGVYELVISGVGAGLDKMSESLAAYVSSSPQSHKLSRALRSAAALATLATAGWQVA